MDRELLFTAIAFGALILLILVREIFHALEIRRLNKSIADLQNRFMARDLTEYAGVTRALGQRPAERPSEDAMTEDEIEQAMDRIPIN